MVVLVIISLVVGVVGVNVMDRLDDAKKSTARTQIHQFEEALELYKLSKHRYPNSSEGMNALANPSGGDKPFLKDLPKDPWDKDYVYISPGTHNRDGFDIMSYGPDGVDGGGDDIGNWKK